MNEKFRKLIMKNNMASDIYNQEVVKLVRQRYSQDEENAILRKKLAGIDSKDEFTTYNNYVESCKAQARKELGMVD